MQEFLLLKYIPLDISTLEMSSKLWPWLKSWWCKETCPPLEVMTEKDWFLCKSQSRECTVWSPCPLLADAMLKQLCNAKLNRPHVLEIVLIPCLMTAKWRKKLQKTADFLVSFALTDDDLWGNSQHKPLIFTLCLPLSSQYPWR